MPPVLPAAEPGALYIRRNNPPSVQPFLWAFFKIRTRIELGFRDTTVGRIHKKYIDKYECVLYYIDDYR